MNKKCTCCICYCSISSPYEYGETGFEICQDCYKNIIDSSPTKIEILPLENETFTKKYVRITDKKSNKFYQEIITLEDLIKSREGGKLLESLLNRLKFKLNEIINEK